MTTFRIGDCVGCNVSLGYCYIVFDENTNTIVNDSQNSVSKDDIRNGYLYLGVHPLQYNVVMLLRISQPQIVNLFDDEIYPYK